MSYGSMYSVCEADADARNPVVPALLPNDGKDVLCDQDGVQVHETAKQDHEEFADDKS